MARTQATLAQQGIRALTTLAPIATSEPDVSVLEMTIRVGVVLALVFLAAAAALLAYVYRRLHAIRVPEGASLWTTLRHVPIALPIALDLVDLVLDVLAAPVVWAVLSRFRMQALRNAAVIEALLPLTQPVPLFTLLWLASRVMNLGEKPEAWVESPAR